MKFLILTFIFVVLIINQEAIAQDPKWLSKIKQIVPIDSTEKDVEKLFGKPTERSIYFGEYEAEYGKLTVEYSGGECRDSNSYKVPKGTVVGIDFSLKREFNFSKLKLNLDRFIREDSDDIENISFRNTDLGVSYETYVKRRKNIKYEQRPKILTTIYIYPPTKYDYLQCLSN